MLNLRYLESNRSSAKPTASTLFPPTLKLQLKQMKRRNLSYRSKQMSLAIFKSSKTSSTPAHAHRKRTSVLIARRREVRGPRAVMEMKNRSKLNSKIEPIAQAIKFSRKWVLWPHLWPFSKIIALRPNSDQPCLNRFKTRSTESCRLKSPTSNCCSSACLMISQSSCPLNMSKRSKRSLKCQRFSVRGAALCKTNLTLLLWARIAHQFSRL